MAATSDETLGATSDHQAVDAVARERRTSPVELLWDLVFAFAVTQVITLFLHEPTWAGLGRSMLALALVWWAWSAFVWVANAFEEEARELRLVLLAAMGLIFVAGLALPRAFTDRATLFAVTYALVRLLHLALYADASRRGNAQWRSIAGFAVTVAGGMVLLVVGSFLGLTARTVLWVAAAAIDYAGPAWLTRGRLRELQRVAVAHFAERYSLFVIICLGESIVTIGAQASPMLSTYVLVVFSLCVVVTVALWWTYFDELATAAERRLRVHGDPVVAAADAYSYLHLVIVAGIILFAVGAKLAIRGVSPGGLALCGGVALYLVGQSAFALRMLGSVPWTRAAAAVVLLALCPFADRLASWIPPAIAAVLLVALCLPVAPARRERGVALGEREDAPQVRETVRE